ncbi:unnamed protein product [Mortierella alpina]
MGNCLLSPRFALTPGAATVSFVCVDMEAACAPSLFRVIAFADAYSVAVSHISVCTNRILHLFKLATIRSTVDSFFFFFYLVLSLFLPSFLPSFPFVLPSFLCSLVHSLNLYVSFLVSSSSLPVYPLSSTYLSIVSPDTHTHTHTHIRSAVTFPKKTLSLVQDPVAILVLPRSKLATEPTLHTPCVPKRSPLTAPCSCPYNTARLSPLGSAQLQLISSLHIRLLGVVFFQTLWRNVPALFLGSQSSLARPVARSVPLWCVKILHPCPGPLKFFLADLLHIFRQSAGAISSPRPADNASVLNPIFNHIRPSWCACNRPLKKKTKANPTDRVSQLSCSSLISPIRLCTTFSLHPQSFFFCF